MSKTLTIRVGPSLDAMVICNPNDEASPVRISSPHFEGLFLIRVNNFEGVVPDNCERIKSCKYFEGRRRLMSFQFQGRFSNAVSADDLLWSSDWDRPLNVPKMMSLFTKFWSMTDPGSYSDINCDTPYMRSYVATAMCTITSWHPKTEDPTSEPFMINLSENIASLIPPERNSTPNPSIQPRKSSILPSNNAENNDIQNIVSSTEALTCGKDEPDESSVPIPSVVNAAAEGAAGSQSPSMQKKGWFSRGISAMALSMSSSSSSSALEISKEEKLVERIKRGGEESVKDRRKYFSNELNRKAAIFDPSLIYGFEVFNPYFNPNTFEIKIPAVTLDMKKITNNQPMRTRLMSKDGKTVFFIVEVSVNDQ